MAEKKISKTARASLGDKGGAFTGKLCPAAGGDGGHQVCQIRRAAWGDVLGVPQGRPTHSDLKVRGFRSCAEKGRASALPFLFLLPCRAPLLWRPVLRGLMRR